MDGVIIWDEQGQYPDVDSLKELVQKSLSSEASNVPSTIDDSDVTDSTLLDSDMDEDDMEELRRYYGVM